MSERTSSIAIPGVLCALFATSEFLYWKLLRLDAINGVGPVVEFLVVMAALFALYGAACVVIRHYAARRRYIFGFLLAAGFIFRLTLIPAGLPAGADASTKLSMLHDDVAGESVEFEPFLLFDSDLWRYLWDGHMWASGINAYAHAPAELEAWAEDDPLWADIRDNVNNRSVATIYPPAAQLVFLAAHAIAPGSVVAMKLVILVFDLAAALFIAAALAAMGRPRSEAVLYLWNPLVIKVFAGSGHFDATVAAAMAALAYFIIRGAKTKAAVSLALGLLFKIVPIVLVPFVWARIGFRRTMLALAAAGVAFAATLVHAGNASGFQRFAEEWYFNAGLFGSLRWILSHILERPDTLARIVAGTVIVGVIVWLWRADDGDPKRFAAFGAPALGALILLGPVVMPWYLTWLLPFAVLARQRIWFCVSALVCLAFLVMIDETEPTWGLAVETSLILALAWLFRRDLPKAAASGAERTFSEQPKIRIPSIETTQGGI